MSNLNLFFLNKWVHKIMVELCLCNQTHNIHKTIHPVHLQLKNLFLKIPSLSCRGWGGVRFLTKSSTKPYNHDQERTSTQTQRKADSKPPSDKTEFAREVN